MPEHTVLFAQLTLIFALSESISNPLITVMLATGRIRNYQLVVGGFQMMNLPISYVLLRMGWIPETVLIVAIVISQCCLASRLYMLRGLIGLKARHYLHNVYFNVLSVSVCAVILPMIASYYLREGFISFILICLLCVFSVSVSVYYIGCTTQERIFIKNKVSQIQNKIFNK